MKVSKTPPQRKPNPWVRLYRDSLHNPKIVTLSDRLHRAWHNCLLMADDSGLLPSLRDIACHLRMTMPEAEQLICELVEVELIDVDTLSGQRTFKMHDWDAHQYVSDLSTDRVRKFREKSKAKQNETAMKRFSNANVTPPDTETDTETDTDEVLLEEERGNFDFVKKGWTKAVTVDRLKERAEGLGLPVDDIAGTVAERKPKNREAYFTKLCVIHLQAKLPDVPESVLRAAIWDRKNPESFALVSQALLEAAR